MNQPRTYRQAVIAMGWVREDASEQSKRAAEMRLRRLIEARVAKGGSDPRFHLGRIKTPKNRAPIWYITLERLYDCFPPFSPKPHRIEVNPRLLVQRMREVAEECVEEALGELRPVLTEYNKLLHSVANHVGDRKPAFGPSPSGTPRVGSGSEETHAALPWLRSKSG
jgi:hypothetical protein